MSLRYAAESKPRAENLVLHHLEALYKFYTERGEYDADQAADPPAFYLNLALRDAVVVFLIFEIVAHSSQEEAWALLLLKEPLSAVMNRLQFEMSEIDLLVR